MYAVYFIDDIRNTQYSQMKQHIQNLTGISYALGGVLFDEYLLDDISKHIDEIPENHYKVFEHTEFSQKYNKTYTMSLRVYNYDNIQYYLDEIGNFIDRHTGLAVYIEHVLSIEEAASCLLKDNIYALFFNDDKCNIFLDTTDKKTQFIMQCKSGQKLIAANGSLTRGIKINLSIPTSAYTKIVKSLYKAIYRLKQSA